MYNKTDYNPHIDGLRAIAVVSVLLFHLDMSVFSGGFLGVDIFFVISGFLITRLIKFELDKTGCFSYQNFYIRRIRRLFPAYLFMLFITTVIAAVVFSPGHLERFGGALAAAVVNVSNFYFWNEADYFDVSAQIKPLLHTWTLGIEEQFYLVWPAIMVLLYKLRFRISVPFVLLIAIFSSLYLSLIFGDGEVALVSMLFPGFGATLISNGESTIFFLLPFRLFEFIIGSSLVWIVRIQPKNQLFIELAFWLGMMMVFYSVMFFDDTMLFPSFYSLFPCLGAALLIYSGNSVRASSILENKVAVGIGLVSYSLYLVHWPIIVFWKYLNESGSLTALEQLSILLCSILLALVFFHFIEKPFRKKSGSSIGVAKWKAAVFSCVVLISVGVHMKVSGGWPRNVPYTVNFDNVGSAANFHRIFYGGAGYPGAGALDPGSPPDIILVGDSHGKHYAEGVYREFAQPNGLSMYVVSGTSCLHLPGFTRTSKGVNWDRLCPNAVKKVIDFAKMAKKPPIIFISHAWINQMEVADKLDRKGHRQEIDIGIKEVIQGLKELKAIIPLSYLVVIGSVPTTNGVNLYDLFTRPAFVLSPEFNLDDYMTSNVTDSLRSFNQELRSVEDGVDGVMFLDPIDIFCDEGACINIDKDKHLIYSDTWHLSTYGSRFFIRQLLPRLNTLLKKRNIIAAN